MPTAALARPKRKRKPPSAERPTLNLPQLIPIAAISTDKRNPRMDATKAVEGLAGSLNRMELLNPILVRRHGPAGSYMLIAGERRFRAAQQAGWREIPAVVRDVTDAESAAMMIEENYHHLRLNPLEQARAVALLCGRMNSGSFQRGRPGRRSRAADGEGMSVSNTARRLGKSKRWVYGALAVLRLPAHWQTRVAAGLLTWETTGRLVGLLDRPDVLAAVEADLAANPADWAKKHEVAARLDFVVAQLDNLAKPTGVTTAEVEPISRRPHDVAATEAPEVLAPITRRSAPVDHAQSLDQAAAELSGEAAVLQILALIGRLDSKEQISRVDAALNARDNAITAACRRSSCNRLQDAYI